MSSNIIWSEFASSELGEIYKYHLSIAGKKIAQQIVKEILADVRRLSTNTKIGAVESQITSSLTNYRRIICNNYKIIYSIQELENRIEISDVFDVRQNPIKMSRNKNDK
jgi:toxin ParE1/3/4